MTKTKTKTMSKSGFILSAIGAAVGLGNVWGFPTKMMQHGGAAFLIPYIIALITLGLPLLILEINMGSKWRKAPIIFFKKYLGKFGKPTAWLQSCCQLLIGTYYAIIIAWILASIIPSFSGFNNDVSYFKENILGRETDHTSTIAGLGKIQPIVFISFILVISVTGFILYKGFKGIEKANKIMVPFLFVIIIFLCIYSLTLTGSSKGINLMFTPNLSKLANGSAWSSAYSQAFFSLGICLSIIIIYSTHSSKKGDNTNRAITIMAGDSLIAILSCVIISGAIGFAEYTNVVSIDTVTGSVKLIKNGSKLESSSFIFKMFPEIFKSINSQVSHLGSIIGLFFYVALVFAAISSLLGILEPAIETWRQGHNWKREKSVFVCCLITFFFGLVYSFQNGSQISDLSDQIFVKYLILISAILEAGMFVFSYKKLKEILKFNNENSIFKLKKWFYYLFCFSFVLILGILAYGLYSDITNSKYSEYTTIEWLLSFLVYMLPLIIIITFFGCSNFWKKMSKKLKMFIISKKKKVKND